MTATTFPSIVDWPTETVRWDDVEIAVGTTEREEPLVKLIASTALQFETESRALADALDDLARNARQMAESLAAGVHVHDFATQTAAKVAQYTTQREATARQLTSLVFLYERG